MSIGFFCMVLLSMGLTLYAVGGNTARAQESAPTLTPEEILAIGSEGCRDQINGALAREQRIFRSVIFGLSLTKDAKLGEVRYDKNGHAWYKESANKWQTVAENGGGIQTDEEMRIQSQVPARKGLLETKRVTTSDLIPYMGQSMRALQCRVDLICNVVRQSVGKLPTDPLEIIARTPGCIDWPTETFKSCRLASGDGNSISEQTDVTTYCASVTDDLIEQEMATTEMVVQYDAAYRTLLQLAGNFDLFLQEFRFPIISSLRQMTNLIGSLNRIPCFLSSCDASPPPSAPQQ